MTDKVNEGKKTEKEKAGKTAAKKAGAKKATARKPAAEKAAQEEAKASVKPPREEFEAVLDGEAKTDAREKPGEAPTREKEDELSEEEIRRLVEESLETVTVTDIVLTMMNQLASVGYMKMGLPENVNLKYRDFAQAGLAIDALEAMIKGAEGKIPEEPLQPFKGTLANLQLNFVQLRRP